LKKRAASSRKPTTNVQWNAGQAFICASGSSEPFDFAG
jgi:hypothetical protein